METGAAIALASILTLLFSLVPVQLYDQKLNDANGRMIGIRATMQDITERKRIEAELERARDAALESVGSSQSSSPRHERMSGPALVSLDVLARVGLVWIDGTGNHDK